jgi:hypothetical protein
MLNEDKFPKSLKEIMYLPTYTYKFNFEKTFLQIYQYSLWKKQQK